MGSTSTLMSSYKSPRDPQPVHWLKYMSESKDFPTRIFPPTCAWHVFICLFWPGLQFYWLIKGIHKAFIYSYKLQGNKCSQHPSKSWVIDDKDALSPGLWSAARDQTTRQALRLLSSWVPAEGPTSWNGTENETQGITGSSKQACPTQGEWLFDFGFAIPWDSSRAFCAVLKSRHKNDSPN